MIEGYQIIFDDLNNKRRSVYSHQMSAKESGLYLDNEWKEAFEWTYWVPPHRIVFIRKQLSED